MVNEWIKGSLSDTPCMNGVTLHITAPNTRLVRRHTRDMRFVRIARNNRKGVTEYDTIQSHRVPYLNYKV